MRTTTSFAAGFAAVLVAAALLAAHASGQGTAAKPTPEADQTFARFRVAGGGQDRVVSYTGGANIVRCQRDAGWADLWIRFAEQPDAGGEAGPHLDIDLCHLRSGGTFTPLDPKVPKCTGGQTWAAWWHAGDATFVSGTASPACSLTIVRKGAALTGTFACRGLADFKGGAATVDVLDGSFRCTLQ